MNISKAQLTQLIRYMELFSYIYESDDADVAQLHTLLNLLRLGNNFAQEEMTL